MSLLQRDSCYVNREQSTKYKARITNHESPNNHLLLIAYGNTLRRDDGAGLALAEQLRPLLCNQGFHVDLIAVQQLTPELALEIADPLLQAVYFFDAALDAQAAGIQIQRVDPTETAPVLGHHLIPSALLLYATRLYSVCLPTWLITIPGSDFELGEGFSPTITGHLTNIVSLAQKLGQLATRDALYNSNYPSGQVGDCPLAGAPQRHFLLSYSRTTDSKSGR